MSSAKTLADLASALLSGSVRVVDLSAPLGPETPVIQLPPQIGKNTPPVKVHQHLALRRRRPLLGVELAGTRRAYRHAFRCAAALDQRQRLCRRIDRPHSGQEFRRARQRHRSLERGGGGRGLSAHR